MNYLNKKYINIALSTLLAIFGFSQIAEAATPPIPASRYYGRFVVTEKKVDPPAWYINPVDKRRYYFDNEYIGYEKAKTMVLGIKNKDLFKIPLPGEKITGDIKLRRRLAGRFLLQVENLGRMWYVHPVDLKRYYMDGPHSIRYLIDHTGIDAEDKTLVRFNVGNGFHIASVPEATLNKATNTTGCLLKANLCLANEVCIQDTCINKSLLTYNTVNHYYSYNYTNNSAGSNGNQAQYGCAFGQVTCAANQVCLENVCTLKSGCAYNNPACGNGTTCQNNVCVTNTPTGCTYNNPVCQNGYTCLNNTCVTNTSTGCTYNNPVCQNGYTCLNNVCVTNTPTGCAYSNPVCQNGYTCLNNTCVANTPSGCAYNNPACQSGYTCQNNTCVAQNPPPTPSCENNTLNCGANYACLNNTCVARTGCIWNSPSCFDWQMCGNGVCQNNLFASANSPSAIKEVVGTRNILTIMLNPNDGRNLPARSQIDSALFGGSAPSVANFFKEMSLGKLTLYNAGILGWYNVAKPWSHYASETPSNDAADQDGDGFINGSKELLKEALIAADQTVDFRRFDTKTVNNTLDGDELVVVVVIPDTTERVQTASVLAREVNAISTSGDALFVDGVKITKVVEVYTGPTINWSAITREVAKQALAISQESPTVTTEPYSLLGNNAALGTHLDPFTKLRLGWLKTKAINLSGQSGYYQLAATAGSNEGIILYDQDHGLNEYFIIENRKAGVYYDKNSAEEGLAIWRVNYGNQNVRAMLIKLINGNLWNQATAQGSEAVLKWENGTTSGFTISKIPVAQNPATFFIRFTPR